MAAPQAAQQQTRTGRRSAYKQWMETTGMPIHQGYFIDDLRTLELGHWEERNANVAFLELAGAEGVNEARVTEVPAGQTTSPLKMALDEAVYVVEGRGLTTLWAGDRPKKTFEWQKHSLFLIPRGYTHQFTNTQGNAGSRLLHFNSLPRALAIVPDPKYFFDNPSVNEDLVYGQGAGAEFAQAREIPGGLGGGRALWVGNFFPDMKAWDKMHTYQERGAGGHRVWINFSGTRMASHMSQFPARTYKKGHRHGPGVVIVIPAGEGYSIMWPEGQEKVVIPWHEASVFVPPDRWFHQHFNVGEAPARYLAFHAPGGGNERVADPANDQIEYVAEDPFIRQKFESELKARGLETLMPAGCYTDPDYKFEYEEED